MWGYVTISVHPTSLVLQSFYRQYTGILFVRFQIDRPFCVGAPQGLVSKDLGAK